MRGADAVGGRMSPMPWWRMVPTDEVTSLGLALTVAMLFGVSGGLLWLIGYNYDGLTGSPFTKIHPFSYLVLILFVRAAMRSGNPIGYSLDLANRRPASALMAIVSLVFLAVTILRKEPGMAGIVDTFFVPTLLVMLLADADERTLARMEVVLHVLMALNALLALEEFATGTLLFPYRFDGVPLVDDTRSTALMGHPLENAFMTTCYVLALLTRAGSLPNALRLALICLQCAALVTFGGRAAIITTLILAVTFGILSVLRTLLSGRIPLRAAAVGIMSLAVAPIAVGWLAMEGFFKLLLERFVSDSGSAHARVEMFAFLKAIPLRDLIVGPNIALVDSLRRIYGLKSGIESPFLSMTLYHGAFMMLVVMIALGLFLYEIARRCARGAWLPMLGFIILINGSESIATKTETVARFIVLILCLYRCRSEDPYSSQAAEPEDVADARQPSHFETRRSKLGMSRES